MAERSPERHPSATWRAVTTVTLGAGGNLLWSILWSCAANPVVSPPAPSQALVPPSVRLPIPSRDLLPGEVVTADALQWLELPADYAPMQALREDDPVIGRVVTERLLRHELIRPARLAPTPAGAPLAYQEPPLDLTPPSNDTVMVIVAGRELPPGTAMTEADLYAVQIQPRYLPEGVFLSPEHLLGRPVCERILQNEFIRAERLVDGPDCPTAP